MRMHAGARRFRPSFASLMVLVVLSMGTTAAGTLSPQEARGKQIYLTGESPAGRDITAYVGQGAVPVPASAVPCGACHGADGLGRPEGGVIPSNITWGHLTKPYGTVSATGQRRPAYTAETLARAIATGIDPAGERLDASMPVYPMDAADMADLIAYLQRLETDLDPGLSEDRITLGTVVPKAGILQPVGQAMRTVLTAYVEALNAQGGIYGRKLDLKVREADSRAAILDQGKELIEQERVFALVGAFTAGVDDEYAALVEAHAVPLVGPFTQFPQDENALQRFTFYLFSGLREQGRALVDYAARQLQDQTPQTAVVSPASPHWAPVAQAIEAQAGKHGWQVPLRLTYTPGRMEPGTLARQLQTADPKALFFFGSTGDLLALTRAAARLAWAPYVFLPGSLAEKDLFQVSATFQGKIFLAFATVPSDHSRAGMQEFSALQQRYGLPRKHLPVQITTYAAAKVLVEGLKRVGRRLSRDTLIAALEKLYEYDTGLTPRLTYGPNRRIGALGAYIVALDLATQQFTPLSGWVTPR